MFDIFSMIIILLCGTVLGSIGMVILIVTFQKDIWKERLKKERQRILKEVKEEVKEEMIYEPNKNVDSIVDEVIDAMMIEIRSGGSIWD